MKVHSNVIHNTSINVSKCLSTDEWINKFDMLIKISETQTWIEVKRHLFEVC